MINFMGGSSTGQGFYYEDDSKGSTHPFSHSSSSCSSSPASSHHQQHGGRLVPLSQHQVQVQSRGPWDESSFQSYSSGGGGGGGASQLDLTMMDSSSSPTTTNTNNNVADRESDEHLAVRQGVDFSQGGGGSTSGLMIEREHMFDKVVTPSDVGKLNRLVIPKQHAEKHFPLDSSTNEKGLLLNFEDRNGKPWRFRYSYWNSSQSYVMTKGWSRFVKEKKLDAGDVVSFQRGVGELGKDRLYIDWRRRPDAPDHHHHHHHPHHFPASVPTLSLPHQFSFHTWSHPFYLQQQSSLRDHSQLLQVNASINSNHLSHHYHRSHPPPPPSPPHHHHLNANSYGCDSVMTGNPCSSSIIYLRSAETGAAARPQQVGVSLGMVQLPKGSSCLTRGTEEPMVFQSVPVVQSKAAAKRLRLFGVNMDCPISESEDDEYDILSSTAVAHSTMPSFQSHFSSSISPLHLRPFNGNPLLQTMSSDDLVNKGKAPMSLDFDI